MIQPTSKLRDLLALIMTAVLLLFSLKAFAQGSATAPSETSLSAGYRFAENSGEDLFVSVCRGCHMSDGRGATGAATYPSLVADRNLEASGYPVAIVVNGQRGMPAFGAMMSNDQVAAVVNFLRTHFGNAYQDSVTAEDVKLVRQ